MFGGLIGFRAVAQRIDDDFNVEDAAFEFGLGANGHGRERDLYVGIVMYYHLVGNREEIISNVSIIEFK